MARELQEVDPNLKSRSRETLRHLFQLGMGLGQTAMREYLRNFKQDPEDYAVRAIWCPLQLPRVHGDFAAETEESLRQFWKTFGLAGSPDLALASKGFPARADFLLWLEPRYEKLDHEFLCLEFSLNGFPDSADYSKQTAHLDELRRYAWFVDSRSVFSRVCAEVSGEGFVLSPHISDLATGTFNGGPVHNPLLDDQIEIVNRPLGMCKNVPRLVSQQIHERLAQPFDARTPR